MAKCLTNFPPSSNKALAHFPIKLMKPDKKCQRNQKAPRLSGIISREIPHSASCILEILKKFIYSEMIDTFVTILKSYADRAVPGSSRRTRLLEYMKMALLTRRPSKAGSALSAHESALNHHTPHMPSGHGWVHGERDRAPLGQ